MAASSIPKRYSKIPTADRKWNYSHSIVLGGLLEIS